jgi:hypothetical protein
MRQANVRAVQSIPMLSSNGALVGVLSIHFPQVYRPTEIELRNLEYAAHIAADAFVPLCANGGSPRDPITSSMDRAAQETIERAERSLSRDPLSRGCGPSPAPCGPWSGSDTEKDTNPRRTHKGMRAVHNSGIYLGRSRPFPPQRGGTFAQTTSPFLRLRKFPGKKQRLI